MDEKQVFVGARAAYEHLFFGNLSDRLGIHRVYLIY